MDAPISGPNENGIRIVRRKRQWKKFFNRKEALGLTMEQQPEQLETSKMPAKRKGKKQRDLQLRERLELLLQLPLTDPQQKQQLKQAGLPARYQDYLQLVAWNLYQKALGGDIAAIREIRGILEDPAQDKKTSSRAAEPEQSMPQVVILDNLDHAR